MAPKLARQALPTKRVQDQDLLGAFEVEFGGGISPVGRPRMPVRLMASLLYLKNSFNLSEEELVERWARNVQWQFFSGKDYYEPRLPFDATPIGQFRRLTRDPLLMKLGAARHDAGRASSLVRVSIPKQASATASLEFRLDRDKRRQVIRRQGRYQLRINLTAGEPTQLWTFCIQLTEVEQTFKEIMHDLAIRPIYVKLESRIEAHIFVAFLAYCLQVKLKAQLRQLAGGTTPRRLHASSKKSRCSADLRVSRKRNQQLSGNVGAQLRKTG